MTTICKLGTDVTLAGVVELVDTVASEAAAVIGVRVRIPLSAPNGQYGLVYISVHDQPGDPVPAVLV